MFQQTPSTPNTHLIRRGIWSSCRKIRDDIRSSSLFFLPFFMHQKIHVCCHTTFLILVYHKKSPEIIHVFSYQGFLEVFPTKAHPPPRCHPRNPSSIHRDPTIHPPPFNSEAFRLFQLGRPAELLSGVRSLHYHQALTGSKSRKWRLRRWLTLGFGDRKVVERKCPKRIPIPRLKI